MFELLVIVEIFLAAILVLVVLMQSSKGQGLAGSFGGSGQMGNMFGTRRTADFLSKATWYIGGIMLALALVINLAFLPGKSTSEQRQSIIQSQQQQQSMPSTPALPPPVESTTDDESSLPVQTDGE